MKKSNNRRSWAPVLNHERIGGDIEEIFLGRDGKITRAITKDENKVIKVKEKFKLF